MAVPDVTSKFVVYGLYDPRDGALRYVGKSERRETRYNQHMYAVLTNREKTWKANWIRGLLSAGLKPTLRVLEFCSDRESMTRAECRHIADARTRGDRLTNLTDGGDGTPGYKLTEEQRAKVSASYFRIPAKQEHLRGLTVRCEKSVVDHLGTKYQSIKHAAEALHVATGSVSSVAKGRTLSVVGFGFRFDGETSAAGWTTPEEFAALLASNRERTSRRRSASTRRSMLGRKRAPSTTAKLVAACCTPVVDQFGREYASLTDAARAIGSDASSVCAVISGRRRTVKGFSFTRLEKADRVSRRVAVAREFLSILKETGASAELLREVERIALDGERAA